MDQHLGYFIIGILVALLIGQQGFWMYIVFKLNDRLMSRNFVEYSQGKQLKRPPNVSKPSQDDGIDPIAEKNAKDANALFAI